MPEKSSNIRRHKNPDFVQQNKHGLLETPGPYVGIIKWNSDPTRSGRVKVFIPDLGGADPDNSSLWYTVSYASPFRGKTQGFVKNLKQYIQEGDYPSAAEEEENSFQSYGFWMIPPDIGVRVLCFFVNSDPAQGYWFACLNDSFDSFMTPGMGSAPSTSYIWEPAKFKTHKKLQQFVELPSGEIPSRLPVSEPTRQAQVDGNKILDNIDDVRKYPHVFQTLRLGIQGLCYDFTRGTTSATSTRESPSQVFGFSTPGRFWNMTTEEKSKQFLNGGDPKEISTKNFRCGGHQLILDDGTTEGLDQGIKIRTSKGNMILLDDTNEQIYIINAQGTAWIEMSPSGRIDIYTEKDFNLRSKGDINFHTEKDFNLHVRGKIQTKCETTTSFESVGDYTVKTNAQAKLYSRGQMNIGTNSTMNLSSSAQMNLKSSSDLVIKGSMVYINTKDAPLVSEPKDLVENKHPQTKQVGGRKTWWVEGEFKSIVKLAPDHEPWKNHEKFTVKATTPTPLPESNPVGPRPNQ